MRSAWKFHFQQPQASTSASAARFKTLACFGYGISAGLLLYFLSIDLAHLSEKKWSLKKHQRLQQRFHWEVRKGYTFPKIAKEDLFVGVWRWGLKIRRQRLEVKLWAFRAGSWKELPPPEMKRSDKCRLFCLYPSQERRFDCESVSEIDTI